MRPAESMNHRRAASPFLRRFAFAGATFAAVAGCGTAKPTPGPTPSVAASAEPAASQVASAAAAASAKSSAAAAAASHEAPEIIIHTADLYGQILGRNGPTFSIASMLVTSEKTRPVVGNKATLYGRAEGSNDEGAWVQIAEAVVKTTLDAGGKIQIKITSDEKKAAAGPGGAKLAALVKGARVKVTWEW